MGKAKHTGSQRKKELTAVNSKTKKAHQQLYIVGSNGRTTTHTIDPEIKEQMWGATQQLVLDDIHEFSTPNEESYEIPKDQLPPPPTQQQSFQQTFSDIQNTAGNVWDVTPQFIKRRIKNRVGGRIRDEAYAANQSFLAEHQSNMTKILNTVNPDTLNRRIEEGTFTQQEREYMGEASMVTLQSIRETMGHAKEQGDDNKVKQLRKKYDQLLAEIDILNAAETKISNSPDQSIESLSLQEKKALTDAYVKILRITDSAEDDVSHLRQSNEKKEMALRQERKNRRRKLLRMKPSKRQPPPIYKSSGGLEWFLRIMSGRQ